MRHVCNLPMALYGARSLLDRCGRPETLADLMGIDFVGFDKDDLLLRLMVAVGLPKRREDFGVRCDDQVVYWNLVRARCSLGGAQCAIGNADPVVERIAPFVPLPSLPIWLVAPEALRQNPRVRRVLHHLAPAFRQIAAPR